MYTVILASASIARSQVLDRVGLPHTRYPSTLNESEVEIRTPVERARTLALLKAEEVSALYADAIVIGCDTLIESVTGEILEKPKDEADARRMLRLYSQAHCLVHTATAVSVPGQSVRVCVSTTKINFSTITQSIEDAWIEKNLWMGVAGALRIEEAEYFVESIVGDYSGIIGVSVSALRMLLSAASIDIVDLLRGNK